MQVVNEGRIAQKARTRRVLLDTAIRLVGEGKNPSVEDVAAAAAISRRTAYRYYRSQEHLLADVALDSLRPEIAQALEQNGEPADPEDRISTLLSTLHRSTRDHEPRLRAILAASLAYDAEGPAVDQVRGIRRVQWITQAVAPLQASLSLEAYEKLISALTVIAGYDAYRVLRQMRQLSHDEIEAVILWMAKAVVGAAKNSSSK